MWVCVRPRESKKNGKVSFPFLSCVSNGFQVSIRSREMRGLVCVMADHNVNREREKDLRHDL